MAAALGPWGPSVVPVAYIQIYQKPELNSVILGGLLFILLIVEQ